MSSSRSDVVTNCVRVSVPFFSFSVLEVSSVSMVIQGYLKDSCSLKEVFRMFQGSFMGVYRKF